MKRFFTLCIAFCTIMTGFAQTEQPTDTVPKQTTDTIKIGGMVIIREPGGNYDSTKKRDKIFRISNRRNRDKPSNLSTNWWIFDIGFSNYVEVFRDKTFSGNILYAGMIMGVILAAISFIALWKLKETFSADLNYTEAT